MGSASGSLSLPNPMTHLFEPGRTQASANIHSGSWSRNSFGYDVIANQFDKYLYDNPDFLLVMSAGNNGYKNQLTTVAEPGTAKNILTVGSVNAMGNDLWYFDHGMDSVSYSSSRGPTKDGRIKPDVLAPGRTILSAGARPSVEGECDPEDTSSIHVKNGNGQFGSEDGLLYLQGTSMSTPVVAGSAAIIRQYFMDGYYPSGAANNDDAFTPPGQLLKAVIINGGMPVVEVDNYGKDYVSSEPYDNAQGFGRVNLQNSLFLANSTPEPIFVEIVDEGKRQIDNGETHTYLRTIDMLQACTAEELSVTLAWTDKEGANGCSTCLLNDLDLVLTNESSGDKYYPNGLNSHDTVNNIERIRVPVADADIWRIEVTASNLMESSTNYALVMTGCIDGASGSSSGPDTSAPSISTSAPTKSPVEVLVTTKPSFAPSTSFPTTAPIVSESDDSDMIDAIDEKRNALSFGVMFDISTYDHAIEITGIDIGVRGNAKQTIHVMQIPEESFVGNENGNRQNNNRLLLEDDEDFHHVHANFSDVTEMNVGEAENSAEDLDDFFDISSDADEKKWKSLTKEAYAQRELTSTSVSNGYNFFPIEDFPTIQVKKDTTSAIYITAKKRKIFLTKVKNGMCENSEPGEICQTAEDNDGNEIFSISVGASAKFKFRNAKHGFIPNVIIHYRIVEDEQR